MDKSLNSKSKSNPWWKKFLKVIYPILLPMAIEVATKVMEKRLQEEAPTSPTLLPEIPGPIEVVDTSKE